MGEEPQNPQEELRYKRITQVQLEIWLADPVTKVYFQCIRWRVDENIELMGNGDYIHNADPVITQIASQCAIAERETYLGLSDINDILNGHKFNMLEPPEPPKEESDDGE